LQTLRRETLREPKYVYLMLLCSFIVAGFVFAGLYFMLYPYLAIAPPAGPIDSGIPPGLSGQPRSLSNVVLWEIDYYLSTAFTSRPALALFYIALVTSVFLSEFSYFPLALYHRRVHEERARSRLMRFPSVCVIVPARNEEKTIETTIMTLLEQSYPNKEIMIVNDGSTDGTAAMVAPYALSGRVTLLNQPASRGKAVAVNTGIAATQAEIIVVVDADSALQRDALMRIVTHFEDERVEAVSGNVKVGNRVNTLAHLQSLEYLRGINLRRRAFDILDTELVVPGAVGAFRRSMYRDVGSLDISTVVEDMDQTVKMVKAAKDIHYDPSVVAFTEVPETLSGLVRQRSRWYGGTLQVLLKHRHEWWKFGMVSVISFPYLVLTMFLVPAIELLTLSLLFVCLYQQLFLGVILAAISILVVELFLSSAAVWFDHESWRLVSYTPIYAFVYRYVLDIIRVKAYLDVYLGKLAWTRVERYGDLSGKIRETASL
jgi:cellulose synthase/poly-beta-1,6-N-acetylglucosamine synthase-like glycosyltransferase